MLCMPYPERPSPNLPCLEALVLTPTTVVGGARSRGCGSSCVACMVRYMHCMSLHWLRAAQYVCLLPHRLSVSATAAAARRAASAGRQDGPGLHAEPCPG